MPATGGSIESVTLDGREFPAAADAEAQRKLGGFENEVQPNGNGTARVIKTRVPWSLDGLTIEIDDSRGDHEFIQELADRNTEFPVALTRFRRYLSGCRANCRRNAGKHSERNRCGFVNGFG